MKGKKNRHSEKIISFEDKLKPGNNGVDALTKATFIMLATFFAVDTRSVAPFTTNRGTVLVGGGKWEGEGELLSYTHNLKGKKATEYFLLNVCVCVW